MRTNVVVAETANGVHHCLYAGLSADEALRIYALLRERGGLFCCPTGNADTVQAVRGVLILDPRSRKHCSFTT